eukprot:jgi/Bigna1/86804/estExt_fgenesh1_pg.C_140030
MTKDAFLSTEGINWIFIDKETDKCAATTASSRESEPKFARDLIKNDGSHLFSVRLSFYWKNLISSPSQTIERVPCVKHMFSGKPRDAPDDLKLEQEKTVDLIKKYRGAQESAFKISQLMKKLRSIEDRLKINRLRKKEHEQVPIFLVEMDRMDKMVRNLYSIKDKTDALWQKEPAACISSLKAAILESPSDRKQTGLSSLLSGFTTGKSNPRLRYFETILTYCFSIDRREGIPSFVESLNQFKKLQLSWIDDFERLVLELDAIDTTVFDGNELTAAAKTRLSRIKSARKQEIKRIQSYSSDVEKVADLIKPLDGLVKFLTSFETSSMSSARRSQHSQRFSTGSTRPASANPPRTQSRWAHTTNNPGSTSMCQDESNRARS